MVPNFSQYRNFIRMNPKEVWTKSIPLLKFQIFITIKRGFLGRGECNCIIFWPQRGHKPPSSLPSDYLRSGADCTLHPIHPLRSLFKMETFPFPTGNGDRTRRKIYFRVGTRPPIGIPFPKGLSARYVGNTLVISDGRVGYATWVWPR